MSQYDTLVVSQGSNSGVAAGMEAFGDGGVPIGIVSSVLADFSLVTLFSSPNMTVHCWIGRSNLPLDVVGSGAGVMRATIARSAGVITGDTVFATGPGKLPIASVIRIDNNPSSPIATLQIQSVLNLFSVTWVELRDTGASFTNSLSHTSTIP